MNNDIYINVGFGVLRRNIGNMQVIDSKLDDVQNVWHNWDNSDTEEAE
jgi:hypothetical protein